MYIEIWVHVYLLSVTFLQLSLRKHILSPLFQAISENMYGATHAEKLIYIVVQKNRDNLVWTWSAYKSRSFGLNIRITLHKDLVLQENPVP